MPKHSLPPQEQILSYMGRFTNCPYGTPEKGCFFLVIGENKFLLACRHTQRLPCARGNEVAARSLLQRHKLYACPAGARFVVACRRRVDFAGCKVCAARRRGVPFMRTKGTKIRLGLCPKTPLPLSCGWIRTMQKHRPYSAADTLSRCLRCILFWIQQEPN